MEKHNKNNILKKGGKANKLKRKKKNKLYKLANFIQNNQSVYKMVDGTLSVCKKGQIVNRMCVWKVDK